MTRELSGFKIKTCLRGRTPWAAKGAFTCWADPDMGIWMSEDVFNLIAIRGPENHESIPGIKPGSYDPQKQALVKHYVTNLSHWMSFLLQFRYARHSCLPYLWHSTSQSDVESEVSPYQSWYQVGRSLISDYDVWHHKTNISWVGCKRWDKYLQTGMYTYKEPGAQVWCPWVLSWSPGMRVSWQRTAGGKDTRTRSGSWQALGPSSWSSALHSECPGLWHVYCVNRTL